MTALPDLNFLNLDSFSKLVTDYTRQHWLEIQRLEPMQSFHSHYSSKKPLRLTTRNIMVVQGGLNHIPVSSTRRSEDVLKTSKTMRYGA